MRPIVLLVSAIGIACLVMLASESARASARAYTAAGTITLVSRNSDGTQGNGASMDPAVSADGRYVAFMSVATNLIPEDTNVAKEVWDGADIYVHDRQTGSTRVVSVNSDGEQGNGRSFYPSISADGRLVAFGSSAPNLVADDTNERDDIFVHDIETGVTRLVSRHTDGTIGNGTSWFASISADGRFVAFESYASNLVDDDTNEQVDVFVHDLLTGATELVSRNSNGALGNNTSRDPSISGDGRLIAFLSEATNLVSGDKNNRADIFVHDRQTGETSLISRHSSGSQANGHSGLPTISQDGTIVTFTSSAFNLVDNDSNEVDDVFVHELQTGKTSLVSTNSIGEQGNRMSWESSVSADGRFVAFASPASNLVPGDVNGKTDLFVHDSESGATSLVTHGTNGEASNDDSRTAILTADGHAVVFNSSAGNLIDEDLNPDYDVFVHEGDLFADLPAVTEFVPTTGPAGAVVKIVGANLSGITGVVFGEAAAVDFYAVSGSEARATVPRGATSARIVVTTSNGIAASPTDFTFSAAAPAITNFTPGSGMVGAVVTITGINFTGTSSVTFGDVSALFMSLSGTQVSAVVPAGAATGKIKLTTPNGTATSITDFEVLGDQQLQYKVNMPTVLKP